MKTAFLFLGAVIITPATAWATPATLCHSYEQVLFSCLAKNNKTISVCGSKTLTATEGYLQYRYGDPKAAKKVEFEFPAKRGGSHKQFTYGHYFRAQVDLSHISFTNEGHSYEVFSDYDGEEGEPVKKSGVRVDDKNEILCKPDGVENWARMGEVVPCEEDAFDCPIMQNGGASATTSDQVGAQPPAAPERN